MSIFAMFYSCEVNTAGRLKQGQAASSDIGIGQGFVASSCLSHWYSKWFAEIIMIGTEVADEVKAEESIDMTSWELTLATL